MEKIFACAFTGHRNLNNYDFDYEALRQAVYKLLNGGFSVFYCGMAKGFDMLAAECLLEFKSSYKFKLIAVIPCLSQADKFSLYDKERYKKILSLSDETIVLSKEHYVGCMQVRDRYMVDNCDVLLSFLRKSRGGTYYTVSYAKKCGKQIIEL